MSFFEPVVSFLVSTIGAWGYPGIFILMAIESSIIPLPSEVVMIPAGYLASQGQMSLLGTILAGTFGSLFGSVASYYLAEKLGRRIIHKIAGYFFISESFMNKVEVYFAKHGEITIFISRFLPGVRHLISIPAGLAKMDLKKFSLYTTAGAAIWVSILAYLGYVIGANEELIHVYLRNTTVMLVLFAAAIVLIYHYAGKYYFERHVVEKDLPRKKR